MHGGSIRLCIAKKQHLLPINTKKINLLLNHEKKFGLNKKTTFIKFYNTLEKEKRRLNRFFKKLAGNTVYGYGAAAKAVTLTNYFNLNQKNIHLIVDDSKLKQKKYLPGSKIKIFNSKILISKPPKYIIILAWNVYKDIMQKLSKYKTTYSTFSSSKVVNEGLKTSGFKAEKTQGFGDKSDEGNLRNG